MTAETPSSLAPRKYEHDGSDEYVATIPIKRNTCIVSQIMPGVPVPVTPSGRGRADIIGFGESGVFSLRNGFCLEPKKISDSFSYAEGWRVEKHVRLLADTTGSGRLDIVGFGEQAVQISLNNGDGTFQPPKTVLEDFSFLSGEWRVDKHVRFMADLRNTGRADIIGFGDAGVLVSLNEGGGKFSSPQYALRNAFGYLENAGSWRLENHLRFLADVTGNGFLDILGFADDAVYVAEGNGDGTFAPSKVVAYSFCIDQGWSMNNHTRLITDLTGNGLPDLIGFFWDGVYTSLNTGDARGRFKPMRKVLGDTFGYMAGWRVDKHPICIADLTGNGCGDIIGFADDGVYTSINNGDGTFQKATLATTGFSCNFGWRVGEHPRFVCDLTGDGCADIIGFGFDSVHVCFNDGKGGFRPVRTIVNDFGSQGKEWSKEIAPRYVANVF